MVDEGRTLDDTLEQLDIAFSKTRGMRNFQKTPDAVVGLSQRLLGYGLTQKRVAKLLGISTGRVAGTVNGEDPDPTKALTDYNTLNHPRLNRIIEKDVFERVIDDIARPYISESGFNSNSIYALLNDVMTPSGLPVDIRGLARQAFYFCVNKAQAQNLSALSIMTQCAFLMLDHEKAVIEELKSALPEKEATSLIGMYGIGVSAKRATGELSQMLNVEPKTVSTYKRKALQAIRDNTKLKGRLLDIWYSACRELHRD